MIFKKILICLFFISNQIAGAEKDSTQDSNRTDFINYLIRRLENDREGFIKEYGKSFVDLLERAKNLKGKFKSATDTDIGKSSEPDKK